MTKRAMTSRQRMFAALKREGYDHVPFSPHISQAANYQTRLFWHDQIERAERLLELGLDPTIDIWMPDVCIAPEVEIKTWREEKANEILLTKEFHTPAGVLRQRVRETEDWCSWLHGPWIPTTWGSEKNSSFAMHLFDDWCISRRTEPWIKGPDDLKKLAYVIQAPQGHVLDEWRMDAQRAMEYARRHDLLTVARRTIVGDAFLWFCDGRWFMEQLFDSPEFVREFLDIFQQWSLRLVDLVLELDVDVVQYRGWYETPPFWGPRFWQEYLAPVIAEQGCRVHQAGKLLSYLLTEGHGAYAQVLKETNVDVFQGVDPAMLHGGDLRTVFDQLGRTKSFWGGVNAERTLESADPDRIDKEVAEAIETLGANGGLILSALIFPAISHKAIMLMIESWKKYRHLTGSCR